MKVWMICLGLLAAPALAQPAPPAPGVGVASDCVAFQWSPIAMGEFRNDRAAVLVPVKVSAAGATLPFQLDTGSSQTYIYDTTVGEDEKGLTRETEIGIDAPGWSPVSKAVRVKGEKEIKSSQGTLGADLLGPAIELDLKAGLLCPLTPARAAAYANWQTMERSGSSPVIRVNDGEQDLRLLLDTGSSAFSVLSTRGRTDVLKRGERVRKFRVPSFDSYVTVVEIKPKGGFSALGRTLETPLAYAFDNPLAGIFLDRGKIDGLIGLTPFANGALAFDFAGGRIAFRE